MANTDAEHERVMAGAPEGHLKEYLRTHGTEGLERLRLLLGPAD